MLPSNRAPGEVLANNSLHIHHQIQTLEFPDSDGGFAGRAHDVRTCATVHQAWRPLRTHRSWWPRLTLWTVVAAFDKKASLLRAQAYEEKKKGSVVT